MQVYIVWVQKVCIRQHNLAKQNVSRVSRGKALPASYSQNIAVSICPDFLHSNHVQGTCIISRDSQLRATCKNFSVFNCLSLHTLSLSITQPLQLDPTINIGYKRLSIITIKFGTKLKPTKTYNCKLQIYIRIYGTLGVPNNFPYGGQFRSKPIASNMGQNFTCSC